MNLNLKAILDSIKNHKVQYDLNFSNAIVIDFFAGGGGASTGLEIGLQRHVFAAVNHNPLAVSMHQANHPTTKHYVQDVFAIDPVTIAEGHPVGWFHASPDCRHHSQAAGGQPRKKEIRDLAWVVLKVAGKLKPSVITIENVIQLLKWGPLIAKRDPLTKRVIKLDRRVASPGELVPRDQQFLIPDPKYTGKTWQQFIKGLENLGYTVEWKAIKACDLGAGTTRNRLYLIARCDNKPIRWPVATHAKMPNKVQKFAYQTAADHIDFSDLGKSIFERKNPLVPASLKRIAKGLKKFTIDAEAPFFVDCKYTDSLKTSTTPINPDDNPILAPFLTEFANASQQRNWPCNQPLSTICAKVKGGSHALVSSKLVKINGKTPSSKERESIFSSFMLQANGGFNATVGRDLREPMSTITNTGSQQQLVSVELSKNNLDGALRVAAFLINYYGNGDARDIHAPLDTLTTKDRLALVTVWIKGDPWVIVDIRLRMLHPKELYGAQGFPDSYIFDRGHDGRPFTKAEQVHMCGNSVSPYPMAAIAYLNDPWADLRSENSKAA